MYIKMQNFIKIFEKFESINFTSNILEENYSKRKRFLKYL